MEERKNKSIKKQEKEFQDKHPHCIIGWIFNLEKYVKNHNANSNYGTEYEWDKLIEMDKMQADIGYEYGDYFYVLCGTPTFEDCDLAVIQQEYTYKEYLELKENKDV